MEEFGGVWRSLEEFGGVWRSLEEFGGVQRSLEELIDASEEQDGCKHSVKTGHHHRK